MRLSNEFLNNRFDRALCYAFGRIDAANTYSDSPLLLSRTAHDFAEFAVNHVQSTYADRSYIVSIMQQWNEFATTLPYHPTIHGRQEQ